MDFEEAFGVELTDAEAIESVTPRMIGDVIYIPSRFKTVRDLVPYAITSDQIKWTREQVSVLVRQIVTECSASRNPSTPKTHAL